MGGQVSRMWKARTAGLDMGTTDGHSTNTRVSHMNMDVDDAHARTNESMYMRGGCLGSQLPLF